VPYERRRKLWWQKAERKKQSRSGKPKARKSDYNREKEELAQATPTDGRDHLYEEGKTITIVRAELDNRE